uniref:Uncharacterized protein n=1 Tax=Anguilla anguilla TaxID=7936 RepID=A0A0E9WXK0_ANGAN
MPQNWTERSTVENTQTFRAYTIFKLISPTCLGQWSAKPTSWRKTGSKLGFGKKKRPLLIETLKYKLVKKVFKHFSLPLIIFSRNTLH